MKRKDWHWGVWGAWGLLTGLMAGCGAGGEAWEWPDLSEVERLEEVREVPGAIWERPAIAYSGFRRGQEPGGEHPGDEEVLEDLRILEGAGFGLLRVYSAVGHGRQVVELIAEHGLDLKVQLGAYLSGEHAVHGEANTTELDGAIELANSYPDIVMGVSVGNEVLVSWSFVPVPPEQMVGYIQYVRDRIGQPVTVNDNWEPYAAPVGSPRHLVWGQIDYASIHTYAYWDAGFNLWDFRLEGVEPEDRDAAVIEAATDYAKANYRAVREALSAGGIEIPIVIGETGWQTVPSATLGDAPEQDFAEVLASADRQSRYYRSMRQWVYGEDGDNPGDGFERPASLFYFSAFDEPWKEADDNWGLWDADRTLKFPLP